MAFEFVECLINVSSLDPEGELAAAMGLTLDAEAALGNKRIKRFSAVVEDGKIKVGAGFCPSFESAIRSTVAS